MTDAACGSENTRGGRAWSRTLAGDLSPDNPLVPPPDACRSSLFASFANSRGTPYGNRRCRLLSFAPEVFVVVLDCLAHIPQAIRGNYEKQVSLLHGTDARGRATLCP
jgi:hypothetical protein